MTTDTLTKHCKKCDRTLPVECFCRDKGSRDGRFYCCRECDSVGKSEKCKAFRLKQSKQYKDDDAARKEAYRLRNSEKGHAKNLLGAAVRRGRIQKPAACEHCGKQKRIHGHHEDYSKPLDVLWLCSSCHIRHHKRAAEAGDHDA